MMTMSVEFVRMATRVRSALACVGVASAVFGLRGEYVPGDWPVMRTYDAAHQLRVALPLGGIGTGTISLGGRGELRDWMQIMDVPEKDVAWQGRVNYQQPFFALHVDGLSADVEKATILLQGPVDETEYLHANGDGVPLSGFPRFAESRFDAAYPFGKVTLTDPALPVRVTLKAFNPLVPCDTRASSLPVAVFSYRVENLSDAPREVSVVGAFHNPVGFSRRNSVGQGEWWQGGVSNRNEFAVSADGALRGIRYLTDAADGGQPGWGSMALVTEATNVTCRLHTGFNGWRASILSFWKDFRADGRLVDMEPRYAARGCECDGADPLGALSVTKTVPAHGGADFTFFLTWSFRMHRSWATTENHYFKEFPDAWSAAERIVSELPSLEARTRTFVESLCACSYPDVVKEAALFNLAVLRSPTVFRLASGELMGWEGVLDRSGSCKGTCKHVWNYEQALPYLFGDLARTQRDVEFAHSMAKDGSGAMIFRTPLPLGDGVDSVPRPAADGQNGCIQKICREWKFSGDDAWLRRHWPAVRAAMAFAWERWDLDRDGVMEGIQHNTMDVNYSGPNAECNFWYLGALRAAAEMGTAMGDDTFAQTCGDLARRGAKWMDEHLFDGEYYGHLIYDPRTRRPLEPGVREPDFQIGPGCMADQLIGQVTAFGAGFGPLADARHLDAALGSIMKYNYVADFGTVFNYFRSYAFAGEAGLVNTRWPKGGEPMFPYPYYAEAWTGIEYGAASAMAWCGRFADAEKVVAAVRGRYEGRRRNPFSEIECGHHYARSLAAWGLVPAWSGFGWNARTGEMTFAKRPGRHFWATGAAWGVCDIDAAGAAKLRTLGGTVKVERLLVREATEKATAEERVCWDRNYPDPTLWRGSDGRFYAYATPGSAIGQHPYLVSEDGVSWKSLGRSPFSKETVEAIRKDWKWIWAPDRTTVAGTNLLYVSLVNSGEDSAIGVFRLRGEDPGEAYDLRILTHAKETGIVDTIDPEVVTDPATGKVWLFFGSTGRMHRVELTPDGLSVKPGANYVHVAGLPVTASKTREKVFEGAYLLRHGDWWYLFVSGGWYNGSSYCLRVGRSRTLEGEFLDRKGRPMTAGFGTKVLGTEGEFFGPGHNGDVLRGADGIDRMYYHSHWKALGEKGKRVRVMLARRLNWDDEGWPYLTKEVCGE